MTQRTKRMLATAMMVLSLGLVAGCGAQEQIGYVDMQTLMTQSQKGHDAEAKIKAKYEEISQRLAQAQQSQSAEEFAQTQMKAKQEFDIYQQAMGKEFRTFVDSNLNALAKEKGMTAVMEKGAVMSGGTDLTNELLEKMGKVKTDDGQKADGNAQQQADSNGQSGNADNAQK